MNIPNNIAQPPLWGSTAVSGMRLVLKNLQGAKGEPKKQDESKNQDDPKKKDAPKKKKKKRRFTWHTLTTILGFALMLGSTGMWVYDRYFANSSSEKERDVETLLGYTDYERIMDDDELEELTDLLSAPEGDKDVSPFFGTYTYKTDNGGLDMIFEYPDGDDNRVVANFQTLVDGELKQEGVVCYFGNSIFGCFKNTDRLKGTPLAYFYAKKEGKRICITDGKNKQDLIYQEKDEDDEDEDDEDDDDDF